VVPPGRGVRAEKEGGGEDMDEGWHKAVRLEIGAEGFGRSAHGRVKVTLDLLSLRLWRAPHRRRDGRGIGDRVDHCPVHVGLAPVHPVGRWGQGPRDRPSTRSSGEGFIDGDLENRLFLKPPGWSDRRPPLLPLGEGGGLPEQTPV